MSAAETRSTSDTATCVQCGSSSSSDAKFCSGCGAPLWDDCPSCKTPARKGQKFCGGCGFHLQADFQKRIDEVTSTLDRARQLFDSHEYQEAYFLASRLVDLEDPRMRELRQAAQELADSAERERKLWEQRIADVQDKIRGELERGNHEAVVALLKPFPASLLDKPLAVLLDRSKLHIQEYSDLKSRFLQAVESNDYIPAGLLIDQIVSMQPDNDEHQKMALKIAKALAKSASKRFQSGLYADALARLDAIPTIARENAEYQQLRTTIDNVCWLTEQAARSPFATPALGKLVQLLTKLAPFDVRAPKVLQQLATTVKAGSKDPYSLFSPWVGTSNGWSEAPVTILSWPRKIAFKDVPVLRQNPTRFSIAYGLALQGLGAANFAGSLSSTGEKSGLMKLLRRKNDADSAWGIDAGSSSLRAVKLVREGDTIRAVDAIWLPYEQPLCRASVELKAPILQREKLDQFAAKIKDDDSPIWAGLPSRETLGRFLVLPPVADKQLAKLIEGELATQFPLASDQLVSAHSITGRGADGSPRAVLVAAKRHSVEQRELMFQEAGIKLAGLQAEPLAMHNFARFEFEEFFEADGDVNATPNAVCMIDAGASGLTLYAAHRDAFWFRFTEGGGEDLTAKLAGALNVTHGEAESKKLAPHEMDQVALGFEALENRIAQTGSRLTQHYQQAAQFLGELSLQRILCAGGVPLMHGWVRHTFHSPSKR